MKIRLLVLYRLVQVIQVLLQFLQVDFPPYKNQAFCHKLNLLIYSQLKMSFKQRFITKEHIKINFFGLMNWFNNQVLKLFKCEVVSRQNYYSL